MLETTLDHLKCPSKKGKCTGKLKLEAQKTIPSHLPQVLDVISGDLFCTGCKVKFPILAGVAVLVAQVEQYLLGHVKGISRWVEDSEIPARYRSDFLEAKSELEPEHIEEDLEAERVNALYLMTHYLKTSHPTQWWAPAQDRVASQVGRSSLIDTLVREYWDHGPFEQIRAQISATSSGQKKKMVEIGCGVGGLLRALETQLESYLGVDSSFSSIALARQFGIGHPRKNSFSIPEDLLSGGTSRSISLADLKPVTIQADFIVCDAENPPLVHGRWDWSVALNIMDMLDEPEALPKIQRQLLKPQGQAIQSCPYIWHSQIAKKLRKRLPGKITDSASAVEWIYQQQGFKIEYSAPHLPWLFFKHVRQLEIYSTHLFFAACS